MINPADLDVRDLDEAELIRRKTVEEMSRLSMRWGGLNYHDHVPAFNLFKEMPDAELHFGTDGVKASWSFRGERFETEAVEALYLQPLLLQQWLIYRRKTAEYEEANRVAIKEMSS